MEELGFVFRDGKWVDAKQEAVKEVPRKEKTGGEKKESGNVCGEFSMGGGERTWKK